jgi:formamidase
MISRLYRLLLAFSVAVAIVTISPVRADDPILILGGQGAHCGEDPHCINRLHPSIPMAARARPGQTIVMHTRNAGDFDIDPSAPADPRQDDPLFGTVHPLTGPVFIEGAEAGDALVVRLLDIAPGRWAWTSITGGGLVSDRIEGPNRILWRLNREYAVTDDLPGIRIPNAAFPGVVTVLPGPEQHARMLARERMLAESGGTVYRPHPLHASPAGVCGPDGSHAAECLRTIPPREHGGNMDIRYLGSGVTIRLPCFVDGCGLAIGDPHYAQGDGEVAGTAIEMDAVMTLTTEVVKGGAGALTRGPHYEGPSGLLDVPSRRFYATTGFPLKASDEIPPHLEYLAADGVGRLENLSNDLSLAARNALLAMIEHIVQRYGYTPEQAYLIASVAVDLRIGQVVDAPNVGVTAVLPLDIFEPVAERE